MTVIAFDGFNICADKMAVDNGLMRSCTKIYLIDDYNYGKSIVAISGDFAAGLLLKEWYEKGENPQDFPQFQKTDNWARLSVLRKDGLFIYEQECIRIPIQDKVFACGSGRDFAMGALLAGANAIDAVKIASKLSDSCGLGFDSFSLDDL